MSFCSSPATSESSTTSTRAGRSAAAPWSRGQAPVAPSIRIDDGEQSLDIQDRHDLAVPEDGGARRTCAACQRAAQLLEHEFLLLVHGIHDDAEADRAGNQ